MKTLLKVLGVIIAVIALVISSLGVVRNFRDAEDAAAYESSMSQGKSEMDEYRKQSEQLTGEAKEQMLQMIQEGEDLLAQLPSKNTFTSIGVLMVVLALTSLISAVLLFASKQKPATIILVITVVAALIAIAISPSIDGGFSGAASNRAVSIAAAIPAFLTALFAFLISRMKAKAIA